VWVREDRGEPGFVPGGVRGPTHRGMSQGGDPAGLAVGADWVEVALARRQTMGWPHIINITAETEVGIVEDPPDQVRAIEGEGRAG
jgi:hypothetical protein